MEFEFSKRAGRGWYPIFTEVQDEQHVASIGCLVTDGDLIIALTNKHVTGEKQVSEQGRDIYTIINGQRSRSAMLIIGRLEKNYFNKYTPVGS